MKKALITGITGQDGAYLSAHLHSLGYEVHGFERASSDYRRDRLFPGVPITFHSGDVTDYGSMARCLDLVSPDEVYHLAGQSHVGDSFFQPSYTVQCIELGTLNLLDCLRGSTCRLYYAGTSEVFGNHPDLPYTETTPFKPLSPYAVARVAAIHHCRVYREAYGLKVSCGILFNHESPLRSPKFVTRKITRAVARIHHAPSSGPLVLGNTHSRRDWGFAGDYVKAMHLMLQVEPDDFVVATGIHYSVGQFAELAFGIVGLSADDHIHIDSGLKRPLDPGCLYGDNTKAQQVLGWSPEMRFPQLVENMVEEDLKYA